MKTLLVIVSFIFILLSCHSSDDNSTFFLNHPTQEVILIVNDETFTVDFNLNATCNEFMENGVLPREISKLKTRDDLINYYKTLLPGFSLGYSSIKPDITECVFVKVEYMLAQECFSDLCDFQTRKEVLKLVLDYQKSKYNEYTFPQCTQRTGVFLMAVILIKERKNSTCVIESTTLQKALLCLSDESSVSEDFSSLFIDISEKFLNENK